MSFFLWKQNPPGTTDINVSVFYGAYTYVNLNDTVFIVVLAAPLQIHLKFNLLEIDTQGQLKLTCALDGTGASS